MTQKPTILFMDDDEDFLAFTSEILCNEGYQILPASSLAEAEQILQSDWVHMMIVDLNLKGDDSDRSGLELIENPAYAAIPKVILTGYASDPSLILRTMRLGPNGTPPVVNFIPKADSNRNALIIEAFENHVKINWQLEIAWQTNSAVSLAHITSLLIGSQTNDKLISNMYELEDLLRRLFLEDAQLTIRRLLIWNAGVAWLEAIVSKEAGIERKCLIACGQKEAVHQQQARYEHFAPQGSATGQVKSVESVETLHFAATSYECIGGNITSMATFQTVYPRRTVGEMEGVVDQLFQTTLASWHGQNSQIEEIDTLEQLAQKWTEEEPLDLNSKAWSTKLRSLCNQSAALDEMPTIGYTNETLTININSSNTYPQPLHFLSEEAVNLHAKIQFGTVYGGMGLDTLFVNHNANSIWLLDFSQAQSGAILRDFVALETALKAELLSMVDLETWWDLERRLLAVSSLDEVIDVQEFGPEVQKIVQLVGRIRCQAKAAVDQSQTSYFAGLFVHNIHQLAQYDIEKHAITSTLREPLYHLLSAAQLCQHLTVPRQFEVYSEDRYVLVEGEKKTGLTRQDWTILNVLDERVGQVCDYEILLRALGDNEDDIQNGAWMEVSGRPKLNAATRRLRQKIEPNSKKPRYILTERDAGYRLEK